MQKLTERQRKFVLYYDGNATQAAIKAGYSKQTASAQASRMLRNVNIKKLIKLIIVFKFKYKMSNSSKEKGIKT